MTDCVFYTIAFDDENGDREYLHDTFGMLEIVLDKKKPLFSADFEHMRDIWSELFLIHKIGAVKDCAGETLANLKSVPIICEYHTSNQFLLSDDNPCIDHSKMIKIDIREYLPYDAATSENICRMLCAGVDKGYTWRQMDYVMLAVSNMWMPEAPCVVVFPFVYERDMAKLGDEITQFLKAEIKSPAYGNGFEIYFMTEERATELMLLKDSNSYECRIFSCVNFDLKIGYV